MKILPIKLNSHQALMFTMKMTFYVIVIGQLAFALYIFGLYILNGITGEFEEWNTNAPHGYNKNDVIGSIFFGLHVFLACVITIGGPLQLLEIVRRKFITFHKFNGRIYIITAYIISLAGLYLSWVVGSVGGLVGSLFISTNAFLIMVCAAFTIKFAIQRQIERHKKWALRLFLCVSGVWFFRVILMLWLAIHQKPVGFNPETFQGPALNIFYVFSYILPVFFLEIYFYAKKKNSRIKIIFTTFLIILTLSLAAGTISAIKDMWLPSLQ